MQTIDIDNIHEMHNPKGLHIVHIKSSPTLVKIVDAEMVSPHKELFASRQKAEHQLYKMLLPLQKKVKKASKKDA
jgi:hypothetical protein